MVIFIQFGIIDVVLVHFLHQNIIIRAGLQFNTYQGRSCFFIMLLHIFKTRNIIMGAQYMIYKFFQCTRSLNKADEEIMFDPLSLK